MKTVIVYKWARDIENAAVRNDGSVDWRNAKMTAGEDDPAALDAAKAIAAASGGQLIGLTIGDGDASWALARGVEQAVSVTDAPFLPDNTATAAILAAGIRSMGDVDVVVIGDSEQYPGVAATLAGHLGWPALLGVTTATARDGRIVAVRTSADGAETVSLVAPAVLGVAAVGAESRTPGMKELLAARKRPVTKLTVAELGAVVPTLLEERGTRVPETTPARVFEGDPALAADQLIAALRAEGVLA